MIHKRGGAWEADGKDIAESVAVEIVNPGKEVVGVSLTILRLGRIDLVLDLEARSFIPMRSVDKIDFPVIVQVTGSRPFGVVHIADLLGTKRVEGFVLCRQKTEIEAGD